MPPMSLLRLLQGFRSRGRLAVLTVLGLCAGACAAPMKGTAADAATAPAGATTPGSAAGTMPGSGQPTAAGVTPATTATGPRATVLWAVGTGEIAPAALREATAGRLDWPTAGPLSSTLQTVVAARRAIGELRCNEAMAALPRAVDQLLADHLLADVKPLVGELYSLLLICADRVGDGVTAQRTSAVLRTLQVATAPEVALVMARHGGGTPFGPPLPPVGIESDPPGAMVARNLLPMAPTPTTIEGGHAVAPMAAGAAVATDFVDIELPGYRKVRRALPPSGQIVLALRPEDRATVILERASLQVPGSDAQAAILRTLADLPPTQQASLAGRRVMVVGPRQQGGMAVGGEALHARVYDLDKRGWVDAMGDVEAGPPANQGQALLALADSGRAGATAPGVAAAVAGAGKGGPGAGKEAPKRGLFGNTKWYTWVVAGGVVALIAGLLIAEKVSPEKVTVSATH